MKFPNLPAMTTLTGAEIVPGTQSGVDGRTTSQAIANLFKGTRGTAIASASSMLTLSALMLLRISLMRLSMIVSPGVRRDR